MSYSPLEEYTPEQLQEIALEFQSIQGLREKFRFFNQKFRRMYSDIGTEFMPMEPFNKFLLHPKTEEETEELNLLLLEEYTSYGLGSAGKRRRSKYFIFETEKDNLQAKLEGVIKPLPILKKELQWVEDQVNLKETEASPFDNASELEKVLRQQNPYFNYYRENNARMWWLHGFDRYYYKDLPPDLRGRVYFVENLLQIRNGYEVAQYKRYLENKISLLENERKLPSQEETSIKRQLLIMEYLGMLDKLDHLTQKGLSQTNKYKILAILLNKGDQSVKQECTRLAKWSKTFGIRTEANYKFLIDLFEEVGLSDLVEVVKNDLDKLNKEK